MILTVGLSTDSVLNLPLAALSPETGGRVFVFEGLTQTYPQPDIIRRGFCCALLSLDCIRFFKRAWDITFSDYSRACIIIIASVICY